tara:strand:+ start:89 stop:316 length:228 start_codon:yes stop_codon:yes gene_type:complete
MKILIYIFFIFSLLINYSNAAEKKDCKELKKISQKIACKAGNIKSGTINTAGKIIKGPGKIFKKAGSIFTGAPKD